MVIYTAAGRVAWKKNRDPMIFAVIGSIPRRPRFGVAAQPN
jgi:hypothetical protein